MILHEFVNTMRPHQIDLVLRKLVSIFSDPEFDPETEIPGDILPSVHESVTYIALDTELKKVYSDKTGKQWSLSAGRR